MVFVHACPYMFKIFKNEVALRLFLCILLSKNENNKFDFRKIKNNFFYIVDAFCLFICFIQLQFQAAPYSFKNNDKIVLYLSWNLLKVTNYYDNKTNLYVTKRTYKTWKILCFIQISLNKHYHHHHTLHHHKL